jgi:putative ABC transport system permease protein
MSELVSDLRFAVRQLRRNPGLTAAALGCLALGIGATTAIFSVVNAVVLRPLPYAEPERLVRLYSEFPRFGAGEGLKKFWISPPEFRDLRRDNRAFSFVEAWQMGGVNLAGAGSDPVRAVAASVSGGLLPMLRVQPIFGRAVQPGDEPDGAPCVMALSYNLWRGSFGGDPGVAGKQVQMNGGNCTVTGVMPDGFQFPPGEADPVELWTALQLTPRDLERWGNHRLYVVAQTRPGISPEQARQDLRRLTQEYGKLAGPGVHRFHPERHPLAGFSFMDETVGSVRPAMLMMLAATVLVLLIACGNVANLLLARAESRQREIAVRRAMGASGLGLVRQFFLEGSLLSFGGAAAGVALAWALLRLILAAAGTAIPRAQEVRLDLPVLAFALAAALFTGVVFGLAPLAQSLRGKVHETLKAAGGRTTATREAHWLRHSLVVGEMAFALVLLVGAALLLDAFWRLTRVDAGIDTTGVLSMRVVLPSQNYREPADVQRVWREFRDKVEKLPGVRQAAWVAGLPPVRPINANDTYIEGLVPREGGPIHNVDYWNAVSPGYFNLLGIRLIEGRLISASDGAGAPPVLVVNQAFARHFYERKSALGRRVKPGGGPQDTGVPWFTVVGVVEDVKNAGLDKPAGPELYFSLAQAENQYRSAALLVKGDGDPWQFARPVRAALNEIDASLPLAQVRPLESSIHTARARPRFLALLLGTFAAVALLLAALGIFSVMSYAVAQRTNEFGIRMALGAATGNVLGLVLRQGLALVVAGLISGGLGAFYLERSLRGLVFGIGEVRAGAWIAAAAVLVVVTLAACYGPARRATRVDPATALRYE